MVQTIAPFVHTGALVSPFTWLDAPHRRRLGATQGAMMIDNMRPAMTDAELIKTMAMHIETVEAQRDMLARRCAEQARHIAGLLELQAEDAAEAERHPLADAIAVMQQAGVR